MWHLTNENKRKMGKGAEQKENAVKGSAARQRIVTDTDEKTHPCSIDKNVTIKERAVETNDRRPRR